ncbi:M15 family metallopeptidase [Actinoplanes sp. NPDC049316]|uniref:M15 family metallopeptidase n=1 Tax=Actinoplanes sp. NPDC049316 TaxID=3154727 RepID=UPI00343A73D1
MTTRHIRARARQPFTAAVIAVLATILTTTGTPTAASASVPSVAQKWSSLMYHSLTPTPAYLQLRKTLSAQRKSLATWSDRLVQRRTTHDAAQNTLTTAVATDAAARTRYALARETLATARNNLTVASQQRPRNATAVTKAKNAVTAAATTTALRRTQASAAAAVLKTAQTAASTATGNLDAAGVAWDRTYAAIVTNQRRLKTADAQRAADATQASGLSRDVVSQVRKAFTNADTTSVNGTTVHRNVAYAYRAMLNAAKADGVVLSGGGFRTKQRQIELRKINGCPDVWRAPASSCRVPTAIPGTSLHELGLAVDITSGGRSLTRDSAGFRWLSANAGRYGFVNLPSEAWHWSITGG